MSEPDKRFTPVNQNSLYPIFAALGNEVVHRLWDGQIVFVHTEERKLNFLATDGSNRLRTIRMWPDKAKLNCPQWLDIQVALSPDGRYAYYSNVAGVAYDGKKPGDIDPRWPHGRIYRQDLSKAGSEPAPFFDLVLPDWDKTKYWMPTPGTRKPPRPALTPTAAAISSSATWSINRWLKSARKASNSARPAFPGPTRSWFRGKPATFMLFPGKFPEATCRRQLSSRSAAVASRPRLPPSFGWRERSAAAILSTKRARCPSSGWPVKPRPTTGHRPLVPAASWCASRIAEPSFASPTTSFSTAIAGRLPLSVTWTWTARRNWSTSLARAAPSGGFHGETGEGGPLDLRAVDLAIGPGGTIYTWGTSGSYEGPIARFSRDLKPAPLPATGKHTFGYLYGRAGRGSSVCGLDVDMQGRVYATFGMNECHVRVYDAKGELVDYRQREKVNDPRGGPKEIPVAVSGVSGCGGSIRVDRAGNIYLLQGGLPATYTPPPGYEKDEAFRNAVGTIYKFPPTGGEVKSKGNVVNGVVGAVARYAGCGPVSRWRAVGSCVCTKPRFGLDDYGRLYIPNAITFSVSVRDNADNEIVQFGAYGNFDCQGLGSKEPRPDIPLGWPVTAGRQRPLHLCR